MPSFRRLFFATLIVLGLAITLSYYRFELERIAEIREAISKSEAILKAKRELVRDYREKVSFYKTREGIEHLAREQYNLVEPGERVIILRSPDASTPPPITGR
ncbi:MAG: hypothetical protein II954_06025 [Synergistaceae bacterium]|nr:hypothetical protein [Synergistaceae bacterium]